MTLHLSVQQLLESNIGPPSEICCQGQRQHCNDVLFDVITSADAKASFVLHRRAPAKALPRDSALLAFSRSSGFRNAKTTVEVPYISVSSPC